MYCLFFFFQAEDGIRDLVRSRGLGDVYKRQQFYRMPLPMLISYRGEIGEAVACQVEMAVHTKALLEQLKIQTYHFHSEQDVAEFDAILKHCFMSKRPVAILTDANFWNGY